MIGYFVDVNVWCTMILKGIQTTQSYTSIMVLAAVIKGTDPEQLKPKLQVILNQLSNADVCESVQVRNILLTTVLKIIVAFLPVS